MSGIGEVTDAQLLVCLSRAQLALVPLFTEGDSMTLLASRNRIDCINRHNFCTTLNWRRQIVLLDLHLLNLVEHVTLRLNHGLLQDGLLLHR